MTVKMELARIIISETNDEQIIILREEGGPRSFPIVIGVWEAFAIDRNLKEKKAPRPMTHDLIENVITGLDARLERITITELKDRTFFAKLHLRRNGKVFEIDSRPSDAIALAVQMKAPIFVAEEVLESVVAEAEGTPGPPDFGTGSGDDEEPDEDEKA